MCNRCSELALPSVALAYINLWGFLATIQAAVDLHGGSLINQLIATKLIREAHNSSLKINKGRVAFDSADRF